MLFILCMWCEGIKPGGRWAHLVNDPPMAPCLPRCSCSLFTRPSCCDGSRRTPELYLRNWVTDPPVASSCQLKPTIIRPPTKLSTVGFNIFYLLTLDHLLSTVVVSDTSQCCENFLFALIFMAYSQIVPIRQIVLTPHPDTFTRKLLDQISVDSWLTKMWC